MFQKCLKALVLTASLLVPGAALAATDAIVTTDLNVRTGPSAAYQRYGTIPAGDNVTVYGCLAGYNWCDVDWSGGRGWVSGNYLAYLGRRYNRQPISTVGISIGVPVLGFDPYDYHRRYYTGRSWYRDRYLDRRDDRRDVRREVRREFREDVREDRRDDRRDFREDRREDRRDLRDDRRDLRRAIDDRRDERRDVGEARRELRQERRAGEDVRGERRQLREERGELRDARREVRGERGEVRGSRRELIEPGF